MPRDLTLSASPVRPATATPAGRRSAKPLPPGIGFTIAAGASLALWAGVAKALATLIG